MPNHLLGEREKVANFSTSMTAIQHNFVQEVILIVTGKEIQLESVALIFILAPAIPSNTTQILYVLIKITNLKI